MAIGHHRTPEQVVELSGKVHERFMFGSVRIGDPNYDRERRELIQRYRDVRRPVPLREALEVIKRYQPFQPDSRKQADPASPVKQFPSALRKFVADELGFSGREGKNVLFWTAVDSFVDKEFGADAVIEVRGKEGESSRIVRLDATLKNPEEAGKERGDNRDRVVIYGEVPDPHFDKRGVR